MLAPGVGEAQDWFDSASDAELQAIVAELLPAALWRVRRRPRCYVVRSLLIPIIVRRIREGTFCPPTLAGELEAAAK
jgi:hypothetical protein